MNAMELNSEEPYLAHCNDYFDYDYSHTVFFFRFGPVLMLVVSSGLVRPVRNAILTSFFFQR